MWKRLLFSFLRNSFIAILKCRPFLIFLFHCIIMAQALSPFNSLSHLMQQRMIEDRLALIPSNIHMTLRSYTLIPALRLRHTHILVDHIAIACNDACYGQGIIWSSDNNSNTDNSHFDSFSPFLFHLFLYIFHLIARRCWLNFTSSIFIVCRSAQKMKCIFFRFIPGPWHRSRHILFFFMPKIRFFSCTAGDDAECFCSPLTHALCTHHATTNAKDAKEQWMHSLNLVLLFS